VPTVVANGGSSDASGGGSNIQPAVAAVSVPPPPAPLRTPEWTAASPSSTPRPTAGVFNTTPRQSGKRFIPEERKSTVSNSSRGSIGSSASTRTIAPSAIASTVLDTSDVIPLKYPSMIPTTTPKPPSQCSLFCCFYAEFDIKVGPMICYQSPPKFMEQDIRSTSGQWETLLAETFATLQSRDSAAEIDPCITSTPKATGDARMAASSEPESIVATDVVDAEDPVLQSESIFDSCSEYIITGSELTGNIISLSTHNIHLVTRPTVIVDENYERNSLTFCVGFVLRRSDDPQPYRPLLSKLAMTLRAMEIESQFLSQSREHIQPMLEGILVSLNSPHCECNMALGAADVLNLKLFRPPRTPATPVKDHEVPILLRRDWHHQAVSALVLNFVVGPQCVPHSVLCCSTSGI
jgi:Nitrogen permease regulator 2